MSQRILQMIFLFFSLFISSYNALTPEIFRNVIDRMVTGMMVRDRIVAMSSLLETFIW